MKLLLVGDIHAQIKNIDDCSNLLSKVLATYEKEQCGQILFLGDMTHNFSLVRVEVMSALNRFFNECFEKDIMVTVIAGNHDMSGQHSTINSLEPFNGRASVVSFPVSLDGAWYIPFMREKDEFEKVCRQIPAGELLFCHQSFNGAQFEGGYYDQHGADPACVQHLSAVVAGHVHKRQSFSNIWYPGTPMQHVFGEDDQKRVFVLEVNSKKYTIAKEIDLDMPRYINIVADTIEELAKMIPEKPVPQNSYKLVAKGTPSEIQDFWKQDRVQAFRAASRRVVDALVTHRVESSISVGGETQDERFKSYIYGSKWRTSPERVHELARSFLAQQEMAN